MALDGSKSFSNNRIVMGVAWAQAGRDHMQDSFSLSLSCTALDTELDFFGVFDGHGPNGEVISRHVACALNEIVLDLYQGDAKGDLTQAIEMGCLLLDAQMRENPDLMTESGVVLGGSCACCVWLMDEYIYSGNLGDSRFILSYNGKAYPVTEDHKPGNAGEAERIQRAGGYVQNNRVNGLLGVARAFGDYMYKKKTELQAHEQTVIPLPDVRTVEIEDEIDFMVIASDGIWDLMENQAVVDFILARMESQLPLNKICQELIDTCTLPINPYSNLGSDNMTIIIAVFRR